MKATYRHYKLVNNLMTYVGEVEYTIRGSEMKNSAFGRPVDDFKFHLRQMQTDNLQSVKICDIQYDGYTEEV